MKYGLQVIRYCRFKPSLVLRATRYQSRSTLRAAMIRGDIQARYGGWLNTGVAMSVWRQAVVRRAVIDNTVTLGAVASACGCCRRYATGWHVLRRVTRTEERWRATNIWRRHVDIRARYRRRWLDAIYGSDMLSASPTSGGGDTTCGRTVNGGSIASCYRIMPMLAYAVTRERRGARAQDKRLWRDAGRRQQEVYATKKEHDGCCYAYDAQTPPAITGRIRGDELREDCYRYVTIRQTGYERPAAKASGTAVRYGAARYAMSAYMRDGVTRLRHMSKASSTDEHSVIAARYMRAARRNSRCYEAGHTGAAIGTADPRH